MKLPTLALYDEAFTTERAHEYPVVDDFEARYRYDVGRERLERAARVLACPVKANPPCWQHGRVLYAVARKALASGGPATLLDIGSAKGFSALCLQWALDDSPAMGQVVSVDVIDPLAWERRNTVAEVDGHLLTLAETVAPWPEAQRIAFVESTGEQWLTLNPGRLRVVFVDGKHTGAVVFREARLIAGRQQPGDVVVFDDVHIPEVDDAVRKMAHAYAFERLEVLPKRAYALGVRK